MIQAYIDAASRCYPQKKWDVRPAYNKQGRQVGYRVGINGDYGDRILSEDDLRSATRDFNR